MDLGETREREREEVFSKAIKAGKRTYFFDVKETRQGERYLTITESKRKFNNEDGTFSYEKHKIFLYKEDYAKFQDALGKIINFIETGVEPVFEEESSNEGEGFEKKIDDIVFD
ncbi:MAG TPA: PUR family DNA/RNA-binding protein [Candidatus Onthomorpha intestinigallinarum]|uniref:PUR family DNA/RNA-binding protein n=1 Tax=Candidatus Onthomorpha intestinigallinarum TaxID=2840880 RepID=A0A9D1RIK9_9BACT|nr:PUR family DNA/RNA-binding protein [Candidatus Onthomorpha intestinigallinarum]